MFYPSHPPLWRAACCMRAKHVFTGIWAAAALAVAMPTAHANGIEPFIGQLNAFGMNFCPDGWLPVDGRVLPVQRYSTLFSILGGTYGGDGATTFALPNLVGRVPVGAGTGPGLELVEFGKSGGQSSVTLLPSQLPVHSHRVMVQTEAATRATPGAGTSLASGQNLGLYGPRAQGEAAPLPATMAVTGSSAPVALSSPSLVVNWCIAIEGVFPVRP